MYIVCHSRPVSKYGINSNGNPENAWIPVAVVTDPHEIANVLGIKGVNYTIENGKAVPFKFYFGAPSCVPATSFETAGARIDAEGVEELLKKNEIK